MASRRLGVGVDDGYTLREVNRILSDGAELPRLLTKTEIMERFELSAEDAEVAKKQREFLAQAITACLAAGSAAEARAALMGLLQGIAEQGDGGFDARVLTEAASLHAIIQPPGLSMRRDDQDLLAASLRWVGVMASLPNLLVRFPLHGSVFVHAAEARAVEFDDALKWLDGVRAVRERLALKDGDELLSKIHEVHVVLGEYIAKPDYKELLQASAPRVLSDFEEALVETLAPLLQRAVADWLRLLAAGVLGSESLGQEGQKHASALRDALASVPSCGASAVDAFVAKMGRLSAWLDFLQKGTIRNVYLGEGAASLDAVRELSNLAENVAEELLCDAKPEDRESCQALFPALASLLSKLLVKQVEGPMKELEAMHATTKGFVATHSSADTPAEEKARALAAASGACKGVSGIEERLAPDLACSSNMQRAQFLIRFGKVGEAVTAALELRGPEEGAEAPISEESGRALVALRRARSAFKTWAEATSPQFPAIGASWDAEVDIAADVASMLAFAAQVGNDIWMSWSAQVQKAASEISSLSLPPNAVRSPKMLADSVAQKALASSAKQLHESVWLSIAKEHLAVLKIVDSAGGPSAPLPGKGALIRARRLGRALIATNWAVEELAGFKPSTPGHLKTHAEAILNKIALKGFKEEDGDMPKYIFGCCRKMIAEGAKLTGAAPGAVGEGSAPDSAPAVAPAPLADGGLEPHAGAAIN